MIPILLLLASIGLLTLFAYVDRLYTEMGKFFLRGVADNIEVFEKEIEPLLKMDRGRAGLTFAILTQVMVLATAVTSAYLVFREPQFSWLNLAENLAMLTAVVVVFAHLVPHVLITHTEGRWLISFGPLLRAAQLVAWPAVGVLSFSFSVSDLAKPPDEQPANLPAETIETLIEKGEEHGIIEAEDSKLIQSVVEFGDKTVREVMTPRPNIVAADRKATLEDLLQLLKDKPYSRVPVYDGALDNVEGFVYTRDLIQLTDGELKTIHAGERLREIPVVPETKKVADMLRELQQQNLHMALVVDEYGAVAGLVTIEDMLEEIVGEIRDESEKVEDAVPQADGSYLVSGHADLALLERLFGVRPEAAGDATTVAGLMNTLAGHVPQKGERLETSGLRFEVLQSSDRLVEKLRVAREPQIARPAAQ
jgi:CBS domain containing-hemolysin-like protein